MWNISKKRELWNRITRFFFFWIHLKVKGFLVELSCEAWYMLQFQTPSQTLGWSWVKVGRSSSGVLCSNISRRKPFVQLGKQNNNHVAIDNCKKQVKHFIPVRSPKELHLGWMHLMSWYDPQAAAFGVSFLGFLPSSSLFAPKHSHTINLDCVCHSFTIICGDVHLLFIFSLLWTTFSLGPSCGWDLSLYCHYRLSLLCWYSSIWLKKVYGKGRAYLNLDILRTAGWLFNQTFQRAGAESHLSCQHFELLS